MKKKKWKSMTGAEKEAYKKWLKEQAKLERQMWREHYQMLKSNLERDNT
jgi:ribosomal protein L19E